MLYLLLLKNISIFPKLSSILITFKSFQGSCLNSDYHLPTFWTAGRRRCSSGPFSWSPNKGTFVDMPYKNWLCGEPSNLNGEYDCILILNCTSLIVPVFDQGIILGQWSLLTDQLLYLSGWHLRTLTNWCNHILTIVDFLKLSLFLEINKEVDLNLKIELDLNIKLSFGMNLIWK